MSYDNFLQIKQELNQARVGSPSLGLLFYVASNHQTQNPLLPLKFFAVPYLLFFIGLFPMLLRSAHLSQLLTTKVLIFCQSVQKLNNFRQVLSCFLTTFYLKR